MSIYQNFAPSVASSFLLLTPIHIIEGQTINANTTIDDQPSIEFEWVKYITLTVGAVLVFLMCIYSCIRARLDSLKYTQQSPQNDTGKTKKKLSKLEKLKIEMIKKDRDNYKRNMHDSSKRGKKHSRRHGHHTEEENRRKSTNRKHRNKHGKVNFDSAEKNSSTSGGEKTDSSSRKKNRWDTEDDSSSEDEENRDRKKRQYSRHRKRKTTTHSRPSNSSSSKRINHRNDEILEVDVEHLNLTGTKRSRKEHQTKRKSYSSDESTVSTLSIENKGTSKINRIANVTSLQNENKKRTKREGSEEDSSVSKLSFEYENE